MPPPARPDFKTEVCGLFILFYGVIVSLFPTTPISTIAIYIRYYTAYIIMLLFYIRSCDIKAHCLYYMIVCFCDNKSHWGEPE